MKNILINNDMQIALSDENVRHRDAIFYERFSSSFCCNIWYFYFYFYFSHFYLIQLLITMSFSLYSFTNGKKRKQASEIQSIFEDAQTKKIIILREPIDMNLIPAAEEGCEILLLTDNRTGEQDYEDSKL